MQVSAETAFSNLDPALIILLIVQLLFIQLDLAASFLRMVWFKIMLTWLSMTFYITFFFFVTENHPFEWCVTVTASTTRPSVICSPD